MKYDNTNYTIVQTGPATWGVQYHNGPLVGGFSSESLSMDFAMSQIDNNFTPIASPPLTVDDAYNISNNYKNDLRTYIAENPSATEEDLQPYYNNIENADAILNDLLIKQKFATNQSINEVQFDVMTYEQRLMEADNNRTVAAEEAFNARKNNLPQEQIDYYDQKALEADSFYEALLEQEFDISNPTSGILGNLTNSISSSINNITGSISNTVSSLVNAPSRILSSFGINSSNGSSGTGSSTTSSGSSTSSNPTDKRVRISPKPSLRDKIFTGILEPLKETGGLIFPYTPSITYQGSASYDSIDTAHSNQNWNIYRNTPSISMNISGEFTCQNDTEAKYTLACLHFIRTLTKMHFGESDTNRGLPPPQVVLDGYGAYMFNGLSIIITNYDFSLRNDSDYYSFEVNGEIVKLPILSTLTISCTVQTTPAKERTFNWDKFASGEAMLNKGWV